MTAYALPFVKGHGTENDFVVLPDLEGRLDLTPALVRAVCDRRAGVGADGVLRVVPTGAVPDAPEADGRAAWFMDYRNADGSVAEMCGNGVRVFVRYLVTAGLAPAGELAIATRAGVRAVRVAGADDDVVVDMGAPHPLAADDVTVVVDGHRYGGFPVSMGNPHVAVPVADLAEAGDLRAAPAVQPAEAFPTGVNVEFVLGRGPGRVAMRVHERGVGETRSCGTGACAAAVAAAAWWDTPHPMRYRVDVPGGVLTVTERADRHLELGGNAVLVATGELSASWLTAVTAGEAVPVAP